METVYIGIGSNLGDRFNNLIQAIVQLYLHKNINILQCSPVYESEPIGPEQPWYLNTVIEITTDLNPEDLLITVKSIEQSIGRTPSFERWAARIIDLDILFFGDEKIQTKTLTIPHTEIPNRAFVLQPLLDLNPLLISTKNSKAQLASLPLNVLKPTSLDLKDALEAFKKRHKEQQSHEQQQQ
ncbi:MAG: 2-amino-4-hydroxy-6-hydroxymethyldihydropteridine diphosphokinase [Pseudomonadota bacterium]